MQENNSLTLIQEQHEYQPHKFNGYPSIENHYRQKIINKVKEMGLNKPNHLWVASEKIHGSNFSIHCDGQFAQYGRRTDFITKPIPIPSDQIQQYFQENFYDAKNLVKRFHNKLHLIFKKIKKQYPNLVKFIIYGQYFGGFWPKDHPQFVENGLKQVQKGICYTPNHEFMAFDLLIQSKDSLLWVDVVDISKFLEDHILSVPIYSKGSFDEIFQIQTKIDSTIPELLGLERLSKNMIEGMVIRPNISYKSKGERIIIKKKNVEFNEISRGTDKKKQKIEKDTKIEKTVKPLDGQVGQFMEQIHVYLNTNRIDSVISKFPNVKDHNKLKNYIYKDIMIDVKKDGYKFGEQQLKIIQNEVGKRILKDLHQYDNL